MLKERTLRTSNLHWSALDNHQVGKPLMIALHGWLDNANSFVPLAEFLRDVHLVALDLPGHGHSGHRGGHYHFVDWIGDLAELVESQGWQSFHLLGHSMGALIGSCYAGVYPERILSLIMLEGSGPLTAPVTETAINMRKAFDARQQARGTRNRDVDLAQAVRARCAISDLSADHARLLLTRNIDQQNKRWHTDPRLRQLSPLRMTEDQAENLIRAISAPTRILLAEQGYQGIRSMLEMRRDWYRNLAVSTLPGGHHFHMEHPQQVASAILENLAHTP